MKILLVHNRYVHFGGEDAVFESEKILLEKNKHQVETFIVQNTLLKGVWNKIKTSFRGIYNRKVARQLTKKIIAFEPDIIHVHNFWKEISPAVFWVAHKQNIPIVFTIHNFRLVCANALLLREGKPCQLCVDKTLPFSGIRHSCYANNRLVTAQITLLNSLHTMLGTWKNKVSQYICLTHFAKQIMVSSALRIAPEKISVKPNFVADLGEGVVAEREDYFLFVGRLSEEKGIATLLEATKLGNFRLEIVGQGEWHNKVQEVALKNPHITYHGFQNKDFVIEKMKKAKALIFPSIWYEGLPLTILEAFSTGTPVIISDLDNLNQIVTHQVNGLHFKTSSAESLHQQIQYALSSTQAEWYENARKTYEHTYTESSIYQKLIDIYTRVLIQTKKQDDA